MSRMNSKRFDSPGVSDSDLVSAQIIWACIVAGIVGVAVKLWLGI